MMLNVITEIDEGLDQLSEKDRDWNFCRALEACHLDDLIPCMFDESDFYIRCYEKVDSELMFGEGE